MDTELQTIATVTGCHTRFTGYERATQRMQECFLRIMRFMCVASRLGRVVYSS